MLERPSDRCDYRAERWPHTANPHLLISYKSAYGQRPVADTWGTVVLWMCATAVCEDRTL